MAQRNFTQTVPGFRYDRNKSSNHYLDHFRKSFFTPNWHSGEQDHRRFDDEMDDIGQYMRFEYAYHY